MRYNWKNILLLGWLLTLASCASNNTSNNRPDEFQEPVPDPDKSMPAAGNEAAPNEPAAAEPVVPEPAVAEPASPPPEAPPPVAAEKPVATQPAQPERQEPAPAQQQPMPEKPAVPKQQPTPAAAEPIAEPDPAPTAQAAPAAEAKADDTNSASISGRVVLDTDDEDARTESTVIYFRPANGQMQVKPRNDLVITTQHKRFEPNVLAIPVGSKVQFPNRDKILHNVFSVSGAAQFDLGLYSPGESRSVVFDKPGVVFVHCNVHHSMQADVLVLDTPWYVNATADGRFSLDNLPNVAGTLHIWHPRAQPVSRQLASTSDAGDLTIEVAITRPKVPKHLNKLGQSYRPSRK